MLTFNTNYQFEMNYNSCKNLCDEKTPGRDSNELYILIEAASTLPTALYWTNMEDSRIKVNFNNKL